MTRPGHESIFGAVTGLYVATVVSLALFGCGQDLVDAEKFKFKELPSDTVSDVTVTDSTAAGDVSTSADATVQTDVVLDAGVTDTAAVKDTASSPDASGTGPYIAYFPRGKGAMKNSVSSMSR